VIELSIEESEKLYKALGAIYDKKEIVIEKIYPPYPYYPMPWRWWDRDITPYTQGPNITWTCNSSRANGVSLDCEIK